MSNAEGWAVISGIWGSILIKPVVDAFQSASAAPTKITHRSGLRAAAIARLKRPKEQAVPKWICIWGFHSRAVESKMAYIVQADDSEHGEISKAVADRKRALAVAIKWGSEGRSGVTIRGDGRKNVSSPSR